MLDAAMAADPVALATWSEAARTNGAVALIDKEEQWTSHDCVARLRSLLHTRKIGHAGTLDPLATGVLIACIGKATKSVDDFQAQEKVYEVVARLGAVTPTDDRGSSEQPFVVPADMNTEAVPDSVSFQVVDTALKNFVGELVQIPPAYSAIRQGGRRQYHLARKGLTIVAKPRCVSVYDIALHSVQDSMVHFTMRCSKGTYVRSVVRDLGAALGVGAYVWSLRRTQSGEYAAVNAVTMTSLNAAFAGMAA